MGGADAIVLTGWQQAREAYRSKYLRQAMYDEGAVIMEDCLLVLHGDDHRRRRRVENRLFRREVFAHWERSVLGATLDAVLAPFVAGGRPDPDNPPVADPHTQRPHFSSYPIVFATERRP